MEVLFRVGSSSLMLRFAPFNNGRHVYAKRLRFVVALIRTQQATSECIHAVRCSIHYWYVPQHVHHVRKCIRPDSFHCSSHPIRIEPRESFAGASIMPLIRCNVRDCCQCKYFNSADQCQNEHVQLMMLS